jgi:hypothetical protein
MELATSVQHKHLEDFTCFANCHGSTPSCHHLKYTGLPAVAAGYRNSVKILELTRLISRLSVLTAVERAGAGHLQPAVPALVSYGILLGLAFLPVESSSQPEINKDVACSG